MTKGEKRRQRKAEKTNGRAMTGERALDRGNEPMEFTETYHGRVALDRWARRNYETEGYGDA